MVSLTMVFTDDGTNAIREYLNKTIAYVDPRGGIRASSSTHTAELVFRSMSR